MMDHSRRNSLVSTSNIDISTEHFECFHLYKAKYRNLPGNIRARTSVRKLEKLVKISGAVMFNQHHLKRMPAHRKVATSQTSELVGKAPKTYNSYPDTIFK